MNEANGNVKTAGGGVMPPMVLWNTEVIPVMKGDHAGLEPPRPKAIRA